MIKIAKFSNLEIIQTRGNLCVEHKENDGKITKEGFGAIKQLKRKKILKRFQILCNSCNIKKSSKFYRMLLDYWMKHKNKVINELKDTKSYKEYMEYVEPIKDCNNIVNNSGTITIEEYNNFHNNK